jgi:hypothetical protein
MIESDEAIIEILYGIADWYVNAFLYVYYILLLAIYRDIMHMPRYSMLLFIII